MQRYLIGSYKTVTKCVCSVVGNFWAIIEIKDSFVSPKAVHGQAVSRWPLTAEAGDQSQPGSYRLFATTLSQLKMCDFSGEIFI